MQPQQPNLPPTGNYDFIMSPSQPTQPQGMGGKPQAKQILVVLAGLLILVIVGVIVARLLSGGGAFDKKAMVGIAQDQTEIIRLATTGVESSKTQSTKDFSITTQYGVRSSQAELLDYLGKQKAKPDVKQLALKRDAKVDEQLTAAISSSTFDTVYRAVMKSELESYRQNLARAYDSATGENAKQVLQSNYDAAGLLLTQLTGEVTE